MPPKDSSKYDKTKPFGGLGNRVISEAYVTQLERENEELRNRFTLTNEEINHAAMALRHQLVIEEELGVSNMVGAKTRLIWKLQDQLDIS